MLLSLSVHVVVRCCTCVDRCDVEGQLVSVVVTECVCCCQVLYKC